MQHNQDAAPRVVTRADHTVSRANISRNALKVLNRLHQNGYQAFLVGGAVRDILLGREPKDFDVATDASPEQIGELFRNSRLIGRRFRLAHVHFGREIIEVATFRGGADDVETDGGGRILRDNIYGAIHEDVWRRDFTVNSLYYNIEDFSIWDYTGGFDDVQNRLLRLIGDPEARYREDPVRMLRAARFAASLDFTIETETEAPIAELASIINDVPPARLFEEVLKLFLKGSALSSFEHLRRYGLLQYLFPETVACMELPNAGSFRDLLRAALANTDQRVEEGKPVTPVFLLAVLLWGPITQRVAAIANERHGPVFWLHRATDEVVEGQQQYIAIPRRLAAPMREIVCLQPRFANKGPARVRRLLGHPRFRAAYDLLMLRIAVGEEDPALGDFWTEAQNEPVEAENPEEPRPRRRRRRRGPHRRRPRDQDDG